MIAGNKYKLNKKISGILMMLLHALSLAILYSIQKKATVMLPTKQIAFLYKAAVLLLVLPWCFMGKGIIHNLKTNKIGIHAARGAFSIMGSICFLEGLKYINATDAAAITFLENLIVVFIGVLYFKEELNYSRVLLIVFGITGAILIIRPGFIGFNHHYIYLFMALMFWSFNNMSIKVLGRTERSRAQLFYVTLFSCMLSFPLALTNWEPVSYQAMQYIIIMALLYLVHLIAIFKAFKFAEFSIVMPFDYARLIFTGIVSYVFLGEVPDMFKIVGYCSIILGGLILIEYEARKYRTKRRKQKLEKELASIVNNPASHK